MNAKQILEFLKENESIELVTDDDLLIIWFKKLFGTNKEFLFQLNGVPITGCKSEKTALKKIEEFLCKHFKYIENSLYHVDVIRNHRNKFYEQINDGVTRELKRQKEAGQMFISDEEIDRIIDESIKENLGDKWKESYKMKNIHRLRCHVDLESPTITDMELDEVETKIDFDKYQNFEYSGNFIFTKDLVDRETAVEGMFCGIVTEDIDLSNNETIYFAFDYGH